MLQPLFKHKNVIYTDIVLSITKKQKIETKIKQETKNDIMAPTKRDLYLVNVIQFLEFLAELLVKAFSFLFCKNDLI